MEALKVLRDALDVAQSELASAEVALMEATARAEQARDEAARLGAAVAALSGEPPPAAAIREREPENTPIIEESSIPADADRSDTSTMSPEEFDAYRKRRQRQKEKEEQTNNPFAHIKCSGCGVAGTMSLQVIQAPSGAPVRMMVCRSCGNQTMS